MNSLPIINKTYELYKGIIETNDKLRKRWRYTLGSHIENSLLECLENLVMAKNAPKILKAGYLIKAVGKLEVTMLKLRLLFELKLANETKILQLQTKISEVGRMLGTTELLTRLINFHTTVATVSGALACFFIPLRE